MAQRASVSSSLSSNTSVFADDEDGYRLTARRHTASSRRELAKLVPLRNATQGGLVPASRREMLATSKSTERRHFDECEPKPAIIKRKALSESEIQKTSNDPGNGRKQSSNKTGTPFVNKRHSASLRRFSYVPNSTAARNVVDNGHRASKSSDQQSNNSLGERIAKMDQRYSLPQQSNQYLYQSLHYCHEAKKTVMIAKKTSVENPCFGQVRDYGKSTRRTSKSCSTTGGRCIGAEGNAIENEKGWNTRISLSSASRRESSQLSHKESKKSSISSRPKSTKNIGNTISSQILIRKLMGLKHEQKDEMAFPPAIDVIAPSPTPSMHSQQNQKGATFPRPSPRAMLPPRMEYKEETNDLKTGSRESSCEFPSINGGSSLSEAQDHDGITYASSQNCSDDSCLSPAGSALDTRHRHDLSRKWSVAPQVSTSHISQDSDFPSPTSAPGSPRFSTANQQYATLPPLPSDTWKEDKWCTVSAPAKRSKYLKYRSRRRNIEAWIEAGITSTPGGQPDDLVDNFVTESTEQPFSASGNDTVTQTDAEQLSVLKDLSLDSSNSLASGDDTNSRFPKLHSKSRISLTWLPALNDYSQTRKETDQHKVIPESKTVGKTCSLQTRITELAAAGEEKTYSQNPHKKIKLPAIRSGKSSPITQ